MRINYHKHLYSTVQSIILCVTLREFESPQKAQFREQSNCHDSVTHPFLSAFMPGALCTLSFQLQMLTVCG